MKAAKDSGKKTIKKRVTAGGTARKKVATSREAVAAAKGLVEPSDVDRIIEQCCGVRQVDDTVMFVGFYPRAQSVEIAGDFNEWKPSQTSMEKVGKNGFWQLKLFLSPGTHRYRMVVDGQWQQDPYNETSELNDYGQLDSVLEVRARTKKT